MISATKSLRVLHVCPELPRADCPGSMAPAARQIGSLSDEGVDCMVYDMQGIPKLKYLMALPKIRKLAQEVDLIHAHFGFCGWLASMATIGKEVPLVMSFMGDDLLGTPKDDNGNLEWGSKYTVAMNCRLAKRMHGLIVKSEEMSGVLGLPNVHVIPNGVDTETFRPLSKAEARNRIGVTEDALVVLFPGNPENPRKGYPLAEKAVAYAQRKLGREIELLPLWNVLPDDVPHYMNAADVMLMASFIEGSPNVVKEAMACNRPILSVEVGDVCQLFDGVTGCEVHPRSETEIGKRLVDWFHQTPDCDAREQLIGKGLDLRSVASRIMSVYEEAISKAERRRPMHR